MTRLVDITAGTSATLRNGWLYTGMLPRWRRMAYLYIVDRTKDMIVASGYNVYPREIEEVLFDLPDVAEVVAICIPDEYRGESVKAFVVRQPGAVTEEELLDFCGERLAPYKTPKFLELRDELPKSVVGKILRRVLVEEELAAGAGSGAKTGTATPPPPSPS